MQSQAPVLTFLGGAGEVTGSCYLVEMSGLRFIVDCGMFQGGREAGEKNRRPFQFDPATLDFVLLTHAHIDHSGLLPKLAAEGFAGAIHATAPTVDLAAVMLRDSAFIQEKEAEWSRKPARGAEGRRAAKQVLRRHDDIEIEPLYRMEDAERAIGLFSRCTYGIAFEPHPGVRVVYRDAGHILGSASVEVTLTATGGAHRIVFSGDLGQPGHPIVRDAVPVPQADTLLVESTYGDRLHRPLDATLDELVEALTSALVARKGNVVIPAFAVGRTQDLLMLLIRLTREGRLPPMEVYVDSPLAASATRITLQHHAALDDEAAQLGRWLEASKGYPRIHFSQSVEDSMFINTIRDGAVIISASGMCDAGRIKHHLKYNLPRPECSVIITGFQAQGTLGRRIVDGARLVRLFGDEVPVRAKVYTIGGLSAHADQAALLGWLGGFQQPPGQTWVVHGEAGAAASFAQVVDEKLGWPVAVAATGQAVVLPLKPVAS
ncbi:MAG: MBL fold metallo-hydrolase [Burkholderiales bacterium]|nr:MBL fold metallo-hydrolase [Burkholderiales bacterium]